MRYLGIDYGTKRLGIATSDLDGSFAFPRDTIDNDEKAINTLARIIELEAIIEVVIGDTRSVEGFANQITAESDAFANRLAKSIAVPVKRFREAWSSQEAARFAPQGKKHDDSAAAAIILQRFLDNRHQGK